MHEQVEHSAGNGGGVSVPRSDAAHGGEVPKPPRASQAPPASSPSEAPMYMDSFGSDLWQRHAQLPEEAWSSEPSAAAASSAAEAFAELAMAQLQHGIEAAEEAEHAAEEAVEATDAATGHHRHHVAAMAAAEAALKAISSAAAAPKAASSAAPDKPPAPPEASKAALEAKALVAAKRAAEAAAVTAKAEAALAAIYASSDQMGPAEVRAEGAPVDLQQRIPVSFELRRHVSYGERVVLVGSGPALGAWELRSAVELCWSVGDVWRTPVPLLLPVDATLVYKYVVIHGSGDAAPASWQRGANNVLMLSADDAPVLKVVDSWTADPLESRAVSGFGSSQRVAGPAERLAAVAEARSAELRRARERADAAEAALARERLASRALRAEASVAASLRSQLRRLLEAEHQRTAAVQREVASFHAALRGFRAKLAKRIGMTTEAR
jgi:hypothetical protein